MMHTSNIACDLLRRMAEAAWDRGGAAEALALSGWVDAILLEALQAGEGLQVGTDEVSLVVPADGTKGRSLAAGMDMPAVQAEPRGVLAGGEQGVVL